MESITENGFYSMIPVLQFTSLLRVFLLLPFLVVLLIWYWNRSKKIRLLERLPSSKIRTLNFLGHMALLKYKYFFQYPAPLHAYHSILMSGVSQVYGKDGIFLVWQILHPAVIVYKAESVEMILNHSTEIKKAWFYRYFHPWLGAGLLTSDGSKWKQRRKLLTPAFHFNILKDFLPVMNKQAKVLVEILEHQTKSEYTELVPLVTKCSFDIICETILGEEMHSQTLKYCDYLNSASIITEIFTERILKPWLWSDLIFHVSNAGWKFRHHVAKVKKFSKELISKKRKEKLELKSSENVETVETSEKDDIYHSCKRRALLDLLLDVTIENNSISEEEIRQEVDTFTFEGHDTTAMAMSWSLYLIGHHPDIQAKIHEELDSIFGDDNRNPTADDLRDMKYLECVFKETLRLYPSVPGYGRHLQQDINFKGHFIPKGSTCFVWAYLLHRDPEVFPNPEKFDPDRFKPENSLERHPFAYVPFSAGLRNCIGQKFAMMEEKCVLSAILRKYSIKSLQPRDQVHDIFEVVLRPYGGLKMQIKERNR